MFSTEKNLKFSKKCFPWQADGTFKCLPTIFCQLYTLHGVYGNTTIPLVYFLLPSKKKKIYKHAAEVLKNMLEDYEPGEIILDFEFAIINSFNKLFSNAHIKACHFYFGQCIFRHVQ